jgi:hypothetical protein
LICEEIARPKTRDDVEWLKRNVANPYLDIAATVAVDSKPQRLEGDARI